MGNSQKEFKQRSQIYNSNINRYIKRDSSTGRFMSQKKTGGAYKRVRKER
ncbi:MAG: hypothetical protein ACOCRK_03785 [bacterium]